MPCRILSGFLQSGLDRTRVPGQARPPAPASRLSGQKLNSEDLMASDDTSEREVIFILRINQHSASSLVVGVQKIPWFEYHVFRCNSNPRDGVIGGTHGLPR